MRSRLLSTLLVCALAGCGWSRWGRLTTSSGPREVWEIPAGALLLPLAPVLDLTGSLVFTVGLGMLNPVNWVLMGLGEPPLTPLVLAFPATSSALTLLNPQRNLDWGAPIPAGVFAYSSYDDEEEDEFEDAAPEFRQAQEAYEEAERERDELWREEVEREARRRATDKARPPVVGPAR
ncbi:MAG: hypothetical protein R3F62_18415 [Planctomycetota bacterium]